MIETGASPQAVLQYQESETEGAFLTGDGRLHADLALHLRARRHDGLPRREARASSASRRSRSTSRETRATAPWADGTS